MIVMEYIENIFLGLYEGAAKKIFLHVREFDNALKRYPTQHVRIYNILNKLEKFSQFTHMAHSERNAKISILFRKPSGFSTEAITIYHRDYGISSSWFLQGYDS